MQAVAQELAIVHVGPPAPPPGLGPVRSRPLLHVDGLHLPRDSAGGTNSC